MVYGVELALVLEDDDLLMQGGRIWLELCFIAAAFVCKSLNL